MKNFLEKHNIPYIWTIDLIEQDTLYDKYDIPKYIIPGDGHPTTYFNTLIANEIKRAVIEDNYEHIKIFNNTVEYYSYQIRKSEEWLNLVRKKAEERNISLEEMIKIDAKYLVKINSKKTDTNENMIK